MAGDHRSRRALGHAPDGRRGLSLGPGPLGPHPTPPHRGRARRRRHPPPSGKRWRSGVRRSLSLRPAGTPSDGPHPLFRHALRSACVVAAVPATAERYAGRTANAPATPQQSASTPPTSPAASPTPSSASGTSGSSHSQRSRRRSRRCLTSSTSHSLSTQTPASATLSAWRAPSVFWNGPEPPRSS
jgi:hypothetical protein